jgi:hypothetical protein
VAVVVACAVWAAVEKRRSAVGVSIRGLMMDPAGGVVKERFAVVYAPKKRKRLSANCVEVMPSEQAAREASSPQRHRHAAVVAGPSTSSESQQLYYLVRWLD